MNVIVYILIKKLINIEFIFYKKLFYNIKSHSFSKFNIKINEDRNHTVLYILLAARSLFSSLASL